MRIAVCGTHCSGKSTLIEDFAAAHPEYLHVPEPYDLSGEPFGEPSADDFHRQLELSVQTLRTFAPGTRVIAERSPLDFLAYLLALGENLPSSTITLAARGMTHLDLLVVLPLNDADGIEAPEDEDLDLRDAMNDHLLELLTTDAFDLLRDLRVIEVTGSPRQRLAALERAIAG